MCALANILTASPLTSSTALVDMHMYRVCYTDKLNLCQLNPHDLRRRLPPPLHVTCVVYQRSTLDEPIPWTLANPCFNTIR